MKYTPALQQATLVKRYKRFLADVILEDGTMTTVYCSNTGKMTGCANLNDTVWLLTNDNPKRKYKLSWELTQTKAGHFICVNTARANQLAEQAIQSGTIKELQGYSSLKREVKYGHENSRIDFLLTDDDKPHCYVEVKSCTLLDDGKGYFPDTTTTRGQKHLRELIHMKKQGYRSVLLFTVLHTGINNVQAASHIDSKYAEIFDLAIKEGVEILSYGAEISIDGLCLKNKLHRIT
ncbi:MAG: DNA/RNA nuclease SfsA [Litorilituus sp.]|jgi:sugar fermentation stimulation protein A|nr:DNA/RNA nuclease SfsA [Litorilituus sp.]